MKASDKPEKKKPERKVRCFVKQTCTLGCEIDGAFKRFDLSAGDEVDLPVDYAKTVAKDGLVHMLGAGEEAPQLAPANERQPLVQQGGIFETVPAREAIAPWPEATAAAPEGLARKVS